MTQTNYDILKEYEKHYTPVPSYEEWRDLKDDLATCDEDLNNVCEQKEELYEENQRLKELLDEAFKYAHQDCLKNLRVGYTSTSCLLVRDIKEVLKDYRKKNAI